MKKKGNIFFFFFVVTIFLCTILLNAQIPAQEQSVEPAGNQATISVAGAGQYITAVPRGYKSHAATLQHVSVVRSGSSPIMAGVAKQGNALLFQGKDWVKLGNKNDLKSCELAGDGTFWALDKNGGVWRFTKNGWFQFPGVKAQQISLGNKNEVYIINATNQILRRVDAANQPKNAARDEMALWKELPETASYVAAGGDGSVWKIDAQDLALYRFSRGDKKWYRVIKPAEFGLGNPKSLHVADKFNIIFVDYQGRIFKRLPGSQGTKPEDWQLVSDFKTAQASIGYDGTIVSVDERGTVLERIPDAQEAKQLEEARGPKVLANQITRLTSKWDGRKVWTHGASARDPQGTNPIPNNPCEILVGCPEGEKDPRPEQASFFMFTKAKNPTDRSEITFGSEVEIWSLYAALGFKNKSGGLGKSWKWWVPKTHYDLQVKDWSDIVISLVADPNTQNGSQIFKLVSPYGLTGPIRSNDVVEIESLAPISKGRKVCVSFSTRWKKGFYTLLVPHEKTIDKDGDQQWFGSKDRGGAQLFSIEQVTDESILPAEAKQAYRSISGIFPSDKKTSSKIHEGKVTAGLGILEEVVNKSEYPVETTIGKITAFDARQHLKYELSAPFSIAGYAREQEIPNFDSGKMLTLKPMWSQGIAWIAESLQTPGSTTVMFLARASDDGNIQIVFGDKIGVDSMFRVIIGTDNNSKSVIKMGDKMLAESKGSVNNLAKAQPGRFIPYWASLSNNFIMVGIGSPGENIFLSGYVPLTSQPNRVGFSSDAQRIEYTEIQFGDALVAQPDYMKYQVPQKNLSLSGKQGSIVMSDYMLRVPNEGTVGFKAQAQQNVTTVLQNEKGEGYRVIIGADNNTKAKIYKNNELALTIDTQNTPYGKLDSKKDNSFWVSIDGGLLIAGQGQYGENIFLVWQDNDPINDVGKIGWVCADKPQTISNVFVASSVNLGAQKEKFSYKKQIQRFKYKGTVSIIKQYTYEMVQDGVRVLINVFLDRAKSAGTPYAVAKTPMKDARYPLQLTIDPTGIPLVYQTYFPTEPPAKIALEIAADVSQAAGDATFQAAQSISGGMDPVSSMVALGLKTAFAGAGIAAQTSAAATKGLLRTRYRSHDSYVFTENVEGASTADASVPPEAERNAELISMDLIKMRRLNATYAPQFEELVSNYEDILRRINHPYVVADSAVKLSIFDGLARLCAVYKSQTDYRLQDLLMNMLIRALSNTYLVNPEDKQDQSARDIWYKTILEISYDVFKYAKPSEVGPDGKVTDGTPIEIPPLYGEYLWLPTPFPIEDNGAVTFEAKALNDVFIGFAQEPFRVRNTDNQLYEVVLGGWENTRDVFRIKSLGKSAKTLTKEENREAMLKQNRYEKYWISLQEGRIRLGKGNPLENVILEWQDPFPWKGIKYIGFSNWDVPITLRNIRVGKITARKPQEEAKSQVAQQESVAQTAPAQIQQQAPLADSLSPEGTQPQQEAAVSTQSTSDEAPEQNK